MIWLFYFYFLSSLIETKEQFLSSAHAELAAHDWEWPELKSIATFGLAVAFAKLRSSQHVFKTKSLFKIDETLISNAMDNKVFRFLNQNVAPSEFLHYVVSIIYYFYTFSKYYLLLEPGNSCIFISHLNKLKNENLFWIFSHILRFLHK